MDYNYSDLISQAKLWGDAALHSGWIADKDFKILTALDERTPDSLFAAATSRPLIVAFFGGTGVGKSSLINRLAGKAIAKTGVERPTSREVTLFHHHSVSLQHLPENLPLDKIKLSVHDDDNKKQVIWIDMPDMDSTVQGNKQLVLDWLPHIDVLVYVVSPERYRDNKAWHLLLAEGGRHAWVFVMNQWDRGQTEQYEDFIRQLGIAGFDNPIVIKTVGNPDLAGSQVDEFPQLNKIIQRLATSNTIRQLELRGIQVRKDEVKQKLQSCLEVLGQDENYQHVVEVWLLRWRETVRILDDGFAWPLQRMAVFYVQNEASLLGSISHKLDSAAATEKKVHLWDEWAQNRYDDALDEVILQIDHCHLPVTPIRQNLMPMRTKAVKIILTQTELAVRQALANPGNGLQRLLFKFVGYCTTLLPLAAMGWVGFQVYSEFYESSVLEEAYLGPNFAVHSVLMIAISWLLPFFLQKQLKPSLEKVALKGLKKGLQAAFAVIELQIIDVIEATRIQRAELSGTLQDIIRQCDAPHEIPETFENETLSRMLLES